MNAESANTKVGPPLPPPLRALMRLALATSLATLRRCVAMGAAPKTKVVVLAGPTAVGKSAAARCGYGHDVF